MLHLTFSMAPNIVFAPNTMQNGCLTLYLRLTLLKHFAICKNTDTDTLVYYTKVFI